jgi:hypothetical protein
MSPDWLTAIGVVAAVISGIAALFAVVIQLRIFNKQLTVQIYSDYTKRYQEIILRLPEDINEAGFSLLDRSDYDRVMRTMRMYFDLCFEEWHLHERKLIREDIWQIWRAGTVTALSRPAFIQAWPIVKNTSEFGEEFEGFIENNLASSARADPGAPAAKN